MTVGELMAELAKLDPALPVFTHGYEWGFLPMNQVRQAFVGVDPEAAQMTFAGTHHEGDAPWPPAVILEHEGEHSNSGQA